MITLQDPVHRLWWAARANLTDADLQALADLHNTGMFRARQLAYTLESIAGEVADDGTITNQKAVVALLVSISHAIDGAVTMAELGHDARIMIEHREAAKP